MSEDIEDTRKRTKEALANLDAMVKKNLIEAEGKIKQGMVKTIIWIVVTVGIYFIWGTTWFFWLFFAFNVMGVVGLIFAKIILLKAYKKMHSNNNSIHDEHEEDNSIEVEYTEEQKVLQKLLNRLAEVAKKHEEIYDIGCREQMSQAVYNGFIFEREAYVLPNAFGLFGASGNEAVKKALNNYIMKMLFVAKGKSAVERLEMFQDRVYNEDGESIDEFFGWVDVKDLEEVRKREDRSHVLVS
ncbi:MAG: Unknown protein [uncultured Sulfurovum sp.]|uniref:Uncharacterized protein n=1 Tax=uncultured Sulfurovum sp. TaxID=269237 RepID=A0A6S6U1J6_9BACT|nr:MAG: Unknown protein [uncultured Sulfurovum sp.]